MVRKHISLRNAHSVRKWYAGDVNTLPRMSRKSREWSYARHALETAAR
ncbi:MAG: hypothetical protein ACP5H8_03855 [Candidatus Micrarchaeia archaeon]